MTTKLFFRWLLAGAALVAGLAHAADTDIFLNPTTTGSTNILIGIDSAGASNATTTDLDGTSQKVYVVAGHVIQALLDPSTLRLKKSIFPASSIATVGTNCTVSPAVTSGCACTNFDYVADTDVTYCKLPADRATKLQSLIQSVNLGVMLFTGRNANGSANDKGGYVAYQVSPMSVLGNRAELSAKLASVPTGNGSTYSMSMYEAYRYFTNGTAENGFGGTTAYSTTSLEGYDRRACGRPSNGVGQSCSTTATYAGPVVAASCNNAIIMIGGGTPDNGAAEKDATKLSGIGGTTTIVNAGSKYDSVLFDEYARFFISKDFNPNSDGVQGITTYTIMNDPSPSTDAVTFMKSAATQGGGSYFAATNAVDFLDAFVTVLSKVQSVNSAFASVALPVSVNVRGTNLNQVYVGMFRPDKEGNPRWYGNMKEYQLAYDSATNNVSLADANGDSAETTSGQLLKDTAKSFWTHDSAFWNYSPSGTPSTGNDNPDGSVVEKGGAAQMAREQFATKTLQDTRNIFTCLACAGDTVLNDPANAVTTAFKVANTAALNKVNSDTTTATNVLNWCRGQDVQDENGNASTTDVRPSFYGDVLHSRPAVINYNRNTSCSSRVDNDVYVYYGSNDGMLKATKGGDNANATGGGKETWAFLPEEFIGSIKTLYDNNPLQPKPFFVDGAVGSYIKYGAPTACSGANSVQSVSEAYIYPTMRRGGRFFYGLDVSPVSGKTDPQLKYKWRISNATSGFAQLGQTWSEPKSATIKIGTTSTPVLIFGGGYDDVSEDNASIGTTGRTMGTAVYVVNATTGVLIWRASNTAADCPGSAVCKVVSDMTYSIPSDIAIADYDGNGFADRLYFGDTGANVWRASIADTDLTKWTVYKLAQFNTARSGESASSRYRKILYAPDVVKGDGFVLVLAGTGDREKPFDTTIVNRLYAIKDTDTVPTTPATDTDTNLLEVKASNIATGVTMLPTDKGWFYTLTEGGEKVVSSPVTLNGTMFYNTNIPRTGCASGLGEARIYAMNYKTGKAEVFTLNGLPSFFKTVPGGGYLPGGVPAVVDVGGKLREVLIVGTKVSQDIGVVQYGRRVRTYWKKSIDQ